MDGRFIGPPHMKSGGGGELEQAEGRCTTITRLFSPSSSAYQADGFPGLSQKCLKRNYDEMIAASYGGGGVGGGGPGGQVMLTEGGCFPRPGMPPSSPSPHHPLPPPHLQQMLLYRQPYSIPLAAAGGGGSSSLSSGDEMQQHQQQLMMMGVQEPKFPPQTFEIPDIQDSNSVFGLDNGAFDGAAYHPGLGAPGSAGPNDRQAFFYGSPPVPDHSHCRTVGLMSFPGWGQQQQQQQQPGVVSSAGSTNSSPVSQMEDAGSTAAEAGGGGAGGGGGSAVQTQQQQQQQVQQQPGGLLKMNGFSTSPHTVVVSRLPNKKARSPKRRKRKDPNEPQKPVSAYSLFFRNAQAAIKSQNPSATFGDVSKIVASMWDSLDDDVKNFYKRQMEVAKKEYLKQLAIYRATLVSKQDVQGKTISEVETGLSAPSSSPSAPPLPSKVDEGSMSGLRGLSPVATSICMSSSSGYHGNQVPMSPEAMSHVMMSPPPNHLQTTLSPRYYSDGPPTRGGLPPGTYCTSSSDVNAMRNAFLPYSQKLDHESLMSGIPEHGGGGYFLTSSSIPDAAGVYKNSREYIALENNFVKRENDDWLVYFLFYDALS